MRFTALGFVVACILGMLPYTAAGSTDSPADGAAPACRDQSLRVREGDNAFSVMHRAGIDARRFSNYLQRADADSRRQLASMHGGDTLQLCMEAAARGRLVAVTLRPRGARAAERAPADSAGARVPGSPFAAVIAQVVSVPSRSPTASTTPAGSRASNPFAAVSAQVFDSTGRSPGQAPTCRSERLTVGAGDNAYAVLQRGGIDPRGFANWMRQAASARRQALRQVHEGDVLVLCLSGTAPAVRLAEVTVQPPSPAADGAPAASTPLRTWTYAAGTPLKRTLQQRLVDRALAAAVLSYLHHRWQLPDRLPKGSTLVLAQRADNRRLVYVDFQRGDTHARAYSYVDAGGQHFVLGDRGAGLRLLAMAPPVRAAQISSGWGWRTQPVLGGPEFHHGIDYAAPQGTPVYAAMDGVVDMRAWHGNYGRLIEIRHADGLLTRYGHLSAYASDLKPGSHVHRGELIGYVGHSGLSTGPHLYFELWEGGQRVDPAQPVLTVATQLSDASRRQFLSYIGHLSS